MRKKQPVLNKEVRDQNILTSTQKLDRSQEKKHEVDFTSIYNFSAEEAGCISFYCCHQLIPDFVTKAAVRI